MADIFEEIREDLRRQQLHNFWQTYGKYIIALLLAIVIGVGVYEYMKHHNRTHGEADSLAFAEAVALVETGKTDDGLAALAEVQKTAKPGYRFLAGVREAEVLAGKGDRAGAVQVFERLAADSGIERVLRDYAELQAISETMDMGNADTNALIKRLEPLAAPDGAFAPLAEELMAMLDLKSGQTADARERLERIAANEDAAPALRSRAHELLTLIPGATPAVPAAPKEEPQS